MLPVTERRASSIRKGRATPPRGKGTGRPTIRAAARKADDHAIPVRLRALVEERGPAPHPRNTILLAENVQVEDHLPRWWEESKAALEHGRRWRAPEQGAAMDEISEPGAHLPFRCPLPVLIKSAAPPDSAHVGLVLPEVIVEAVEHSSDVRYLLLRVHDVEKLAV